MQIGFRLSAVVAVFMVQADAAAAWLTIPAQTLLLRRSGPAFTTRSSGFRVQNSVLRSARKTVRSCSLDVLSVLSPGASGDSTGSTTSNEQLLLAIVRGEVDVKSLGLESADEREIITIVKNMIDDVRPVLPEGVPDGAPQTAGKEGLVSMWTAGPSALDLRQVSPPRNMWAEEFPGVAGAKYIHNVLSKDECERILDLSERMGFTEHNLAKNLHAAVTWVADLDAVIVPIFQRCLPFLPVHLRVGDRDRTACGLNARLRIYRYQPEQRPDDSR
jgi:hypothetical protein